MKNLFVDYGEMFRFAQHDNAFRREESALPQRESAAMIDPLFPRPGQRAVADIELARAAADQRVVEKPGDGVLGQPEANGGVAKRKQRHHPRSTNDRTRTNRTNADGS